jgi:hypothetical protein
MFGAERHQGKDYSEFKGHHRVVQMLHGATWCSFFLVATWCSCEVALHDRRHPGEECFSHAYGIERHQIIQSLYSTTRPSNLALAI